MEFLCKLIRSFVLILQLFCFAISIVAKGISQPGIAYYYDYKTKTKRPIANVSLKVAYAKPTISRADGTFTLVFDGLYMGQKITNSEPPYYKGMKVFNKKEVDNWFIVDAQLRLIMCDYEEFELVKRKWYNQGVASIQKRYHVEIAALKKESDDYYRKLSILQEKYNRIMDDMRNNADAMARIDQSELDAQMQEVLSLYEQGLVDEAMKILEGLHLEESFIKTLNRKHYHEKETKAATEDSLQLLAKLRSSVDLYKQNGEYDKAKKILKLLADKLNTTKDIFNYASFCSMQHNYQEGIVYYQRVLGIVRQLAMENPDTYTPYVGRILNNLGLTYRNVQRFDEAKQMFDEAMEIYKKTYDSNPQAVVLDIPFTMRNLANLYMDLQRFDTAEQFHIVALQFYQQVAKDNPQIYEEEVANSLNNLANLYVKVQRFDKAEQNYQKSLKILKRLAYDNPQAYEPNVAITLFNMAEMYNDKKQFDYAEKMFKETLEIDKRLAMKNPQAYEPNVVSSLDALGRIYQNTHRYAESERMYSKAINICQRLTESNPLAYDPILAQSLNNFASLYHYTQRYVEAEQLYKKEIEIFERLVRVNSQVFEPNFASALSNLASLYSKTQRFDESEQMHKNALEICRRLAKNNPIAYEPLLANSLGNYADLQNHTHRYNEAEKFYNESLNIFKRLANKNPQIYNVGLARILCNASFNYIFMKEFYKAENYARKALSIDPKLQIITTNLAVAMLFQGNYLEAEKLYFQYKDELKNNFLDDLRQFDEAGVIPKESKEDVEKIKRMLNAQ